jgi:hypothetical protein
MPVMKTTKGGKVAYKYGKSGKSYGGEAGKSKAAKQGRAIEASKKGRVRYG